MKIKEMCGRFKIEIIAVGNGTADTFVAVDQDTYTANINPDGNGNITIDVNADVATDSAGNGNTAATQVTVIYDAIVPTVTISSPTGTAT